MTRKSDPDTYAVQLPAPVPLTEWDGTSTAYDSGTVRVPLAVAHQLVDLAGGTTSTPLPDPSSITAPAADGPPVDPTA